MTSISRTPRRSLRLSCISPKLGETSTWRDAIWPAPKPSTKGWRGSLGAQQRLLWVLWVRAARSMAELLDWWDSAACQCTYITALEPSDKPPPPPTESDRVEFTVDWRDR